MVMSRRGNNRDEEEQDKVSQRGNSSKSKFKYHAPTVEDVRERATQHTATFDAIYQNFPIWKAKGGDNLIRILPATWEAHRHYGYDVYIHRGIGPDNSSYLCVKQMNGEPCYICEERIYLDKIKETEDSEKLKPQKRVVAWIIDRNKEDEGPYIWEYSPTTDKTIANLQQERDGTLVLIDHPDKGFDVEFTREGTTMTNTKYLGWKISRRSSPVSDDDDQQEKWLDFITEHPISDILVFYSEEHIKAVFSGQVESADKDLDKPQERIRNKSLREELDDEIPEEKPKPRSRERIRDDDVEEVKPRTRRIVEREISEDDEENDEENEDPPFEREEKPVSRLSQQTRDRLDKLAERRNQR